MSAPLLETCLRLVVGDTDAAEGLIGDLREECANSKVRVPHDMRYRWLLGVLAAHYALARVFTRNHSKSPGGQRGSSVATIWEESRIVLRGLARSPRFTAVAVLSVALGVGANTLVFSVVDGILLRSPAFPNAERAVYLTLDNAPLDRMGWPFTYTAFEIVRDRATTFAHASVFFPVYQTVVGEEGPQRLAGVRVSASLFDVAGDTPQVGRFFTAEEDSPGAPGVVVLSDEFWTSHFSRDPDVVGRSITLGIQTFEVVGVLRPGFRIIEPLQVRTWGVAQQRLDFYIPIATFAASQAPRIFAFPLVATLSAGATIGMARAELAALTAPYWAQLGGRDVAWQSRVGSYRGYITGEIRPALVAVAGAVASVFLIVCANLSTLFLVRGAERGREWSVRKALGARPRDVVRLVGLECIVVSGAGAVLGASLAWWGGSHLPAFLPPNVPRVADVTIDARALVFTIVAALIAGTMFGVVPAWWSARRDPAGALGRRGGGLSRRARNFLEATVVGEVAVALVLLVSGGLLVQSFTGLLGTDRGYEVDGVVSATLQLSETAYPSDGDLRQFIRDAVSELRQMPDVEAVGGMSFAFGAAPTTQISVAGLTSIPSVPQMTVIPGTFEALEIEVRMGRPFDLADDELAQAVAIINESLAARLWPSESALGHRLAIGSYRRIFRGGGKMPDELREIVGVVADVRTAGVDGSKVIDAVYLPALQDPWDRTTWLVRFANEEPSRMGAAVVEALRNVDPLQPVYDVEAFKDVTLRSIARERFSAVLLSVFAGAALALAALGLYGVVAYGVNLQSRDIGLRVALGASPRTVVAGVLRRAIKPVAAGLVLGLPLAAAAGRLESGMLYGIAAIDGATIVSMVCGVALVSVLAAFGPARRAARIDPMIVLNAD